MTFKNAVVITQPDFFPWIGSIEKLFIADSFVFLNHVTNRPGDGLWTKRVKLLMNRQPCWLGLPLKKDPFREFVPINEMIVADDGKCRIKVMSTIKNNYSKAPFFHDIYPLIESTVSFESDKICDINVHFILTLLKAFEITKKIFFSSDFEFDSTSNHLLIDIVKKVNGDAYIYGSGSLNYLDFDLWAENKINLIPQNHVHPVYSHFNSNEFFPGLSIIDVLMNLGIEGTKSIMRTKNELV
jgi:hypothetical protein